MTLRLCSVLVVVCLLWQPFAALLPAGLDVRAEQLRHAIVHDQERGHHHHDDASLHLDASDAPDHQHATDGGQPQAMASARLDLGLVRLPSRIAAVDPVRPPSVDLDGLLRPPRAARA